ncbi:MAG: cyclic lactone autoinducer peptide [Bacillota bacterium]
MKQRVAKLLTKVAQANVSSVSAFYSYQPEVPAAVKKLEK